MASLSEEDEEAQQQASSTAPTRSAPPLPAHPPKIPPPPSEHPPPYTPFGGQAANDTLLPTAQPRSGQQAAAGQSNNRNSRVIQPRGRHINYRLSHEHLLFF